MSVKAPLSPLTPDPRYAQSYDGATGLVSTQAETLPRWAIQSASAPAAGVAYISRITLVNGAYTTVTLGVSTQGVTLTNSFLGLYDTSFNRLAVSADLSTSLAAVAANTTGTFTLNYTATVGDYFLALLVGSAVTMLQPWRGTAFTTSGFLSLAPRLAARTTSSALTSLPDPLGAIADTLTAPHWWFRYQ